MSTGAISYMKTLREAKFSQKQAEAIVEGFSDKFLPTLVTKVDLDLSASRAVNKIILGNLVIAGVLFAALQLFPA